MKKALWVAAALLVAGVFFASLALAIVGFDFTEFGTDQKVKVSETIIGSFTDLWIDVDTCDVTFAPSADGTCYIKGQTTNHCPISAEVQDDTLVITQLDNRKWYEYISFYGISGNITLYLPTAQYNTLTVQADTADISISKAFLFESAQVETDTGDIHFYAALNNNLQIQTDTGDVFLKNIHTPGNIRIETDTGDVTLTDVICGKLDIEVDTGDISFSRCDADAINIETDTGDVTGSLLSTKIFIVDTSTGDVVLPEPASSNSHAGKAVITSSTGDILLTIDMNPNK